MAKIKERPLKVLQALSQMTKPAKPSQIGEAIGEKPIDVGRHLGELLKAGLAEKTDEAENLWAITEGGAEYLTSVEETPVSQPHVTGPVTAPPAGEATVPSQADLFRGIGERLGVGARKGDIRLDAIIYYVQRTADLDNLSKVWNALTEMGVANDVKKRWIKLYVQNLPSKEIPEELKEKLEAGLEPEKIRAEAEGLPPKPKRFSVVGDEIIGDLEGDLSFKEALQYLAQQKGVPVAQANPLAAMVEAMKLGPEMATATLTTMIPLITKEAPQDTTLDKLEKLGLLKKPEGGEASILAQLDSLGLLRKQGDEGRATQLEVLDKLDTLGMLKKPGEGESTANETVRALEAQIKQLTDQLHTRELEGLKGAISALSTQVTELRNQTATQGKLEGRYAILDKGLGTLDNQLTGARTDLKEALDTLSQAGGPGPRARTAEERAKITKGLKGAVKLEQRAHELEEELLFSGGKG